MVIKPKIRGFICTNAHPVGCEAHVNEQIAYVKEQVTTEKGPKNVLVIGASTGYGLASRITATFGYNASTLGIFFEKPPTDKKKQHLLVGITRLLFKKRQMKRAFTLKILTVTLFHMPLKRKQLKQLKRIWGKLI